MLNYYTDKKYVPKDMDVVSRNNAYFGITNISDTEEVKRVLKEIENAEYISAALYKSDLVGGAVSVQHLSTGCKTALNVLSSPEKCFNLISCGDNAIRSILKMRNGNVLCEAPPIVFGTEECSTVVNREHICNNLKEFKEVLNDVFFS